MSFTVEELKVCKDWLGEEQAKAIGSFPSSFGSISGQNEIVRVFEIPTSEDITLLLRFLEELTSVNAIADNFTAAAECLTVSGPMCDGQIKEGLYRNSSVKLYRQKRQTDNTEFFYLVQTLRRGYITTVQTQYEFTAASTDSSPDLNGINFVDSGETLNAEKIHYDTTGVYAKWFNGTNWIISLVANVGDDVELSYPLIITAVGAGSASCDGDYVYQGMVQDNEEYGPQRLWKKGNIELGYGINSISDVSFFDRTSSALYYYGTLDANGIPLSGSFLSDGGTNPPPTLEYSLVAFDHFICATETGNYAGVGAWTGTVAISALTPPQYDFSEFIIADGNLWHSGASTTVLRLRNVNPDYVEQIRAELQASATFSDIVTRYDTLTGTHYFINAKPQPEDDDSYSILLFLSKHNNTDLYFKYQADERTIKGNYYKWDATPDTLEALTLQALFDNSTGELVDPPPVLYPSGSNIAELLGYPIQFSEWSADGMHAQYIDSNNDIAVFESYGVWYIFRISTSSILYTCSASSPIAPMIGWVTVGGAGTLSYLGRGAYPSSVSAIWEKTTGRSVEKRSFSRNQEDRLFGTEFEITWNFPFSESLVISGKIILRGININPDSDSTVPGECKKHDSGTLVSWDSFKTYLAGYRGQLSVRNGNAGLIDYDGVFMLDTDTDLSISFRPNRSSLNVKYYQFGATLEEMLALLEDRVFSPDGSSMIL